MGDLISLSDRRAARRAVRHTPTPPRFVYSPACPLSYLAGERIERLLGDVQWIPVTVAPPAYPRELLALAAHQARELRLPLVEPEDYPTAGREIARAAVAATAAGAGRRFGLAAMRLAFCGGYSLSAPETIMAAAVAALLPVDEILAAAADAAYDVQLGQNAQLLGAFSADLTPAISVADCWFSGYEALDSAVALNGARAASAPVA